MVEIISPANYTGTKISHCEIPLFTLNHDDAPQPILPLYLVLHVIYITMVVTTVISILPRVLAYHGLLYLCSLMKVASRRIWQYILLISVIHAQFKHQRDIHCKSFLILSVLSHRATTIPGLLDPQWLVSDVLVYLPRWQGSWGLHGAHLGTTGPRLALCWPREPCYQGLVSIGWLGNSYRKIW